MHRLLVLAPVLAALLPLPSGPAPDPAPAACCDPEAAAEAPLGLDRITALAGTWVALDDAGAPTERVVTELRTTAGGTAVLETIFPGEPHEMISVYAVDDGRLMLTHYCMMGNQPRYDVIEEEDDELVFRCRGGGNLADHDRPHMHEGRMRLVGDDRIDSKWTAVAAGEVVEVVEFRLQRRRR